MGKEMMVLFDKFINNEQKREVSVEALDATPLWHGR